jgi:phage tail-like protein
MARTKPQDPYRNFRFVVSWDGKPIAGVSKVTGLKRTTEVVKHRSGGDPSSSFKLPGRTEYEAITLEHGLTTDKDFLDWATLIHSYDNGVSAATFRKDLTIDIYDLQGAAGKGSPVITYEVYDCWVSEFQGMPDLDANANAVAIEHIKIENEGWVRK